MSILLFEASHTYTCLLSLYSHGAALMAQLASKLKQKFTCLSFSSVVITDMSHHTWSHPTF